MSLENEERNSAYEKLTPQRKQLVDKVMENLEKVNLFWSQGWVSSGAPESAVTGKKYFRNKEAEKKNGRKDDRKTGTE